MGRSPAAGAIGIFAAVLGAAVSVFKLIPYAKEYRVGVDDVASVLMVVGIILWMITAYVLILLAGIRWILRKRGKGGWSNGVQALLDVGWGWGAVFVFGTVPMTVGPFDEEPTSTRLLAAWFIASVAGAAYWATKNWKRHRAEREQQCQWCKEWVHLEAVRCRYCGSITKATEQRTPAPVTGAPVQQPPGVS